mmetsp:Transcript_16745/g.37655  ORF Transcript_16745/g.37655 Transcript_16745/m.37655 type:complete len:100 (-) Transcript_16745:588-887(-)
MTFQYLFTACVLPFLAGSVAASAVKQLTENSDIEGKALFLKFFVPGCENCREIDSVWEALAEEFAGDERFVIGEVDCSGSGKKLCEDEYVDTYPSLRYG